jgi:hypothetical protein
MAKDVYLHVPQHRHGLLLEPCPLCGSATEMWSYETSRVTTKVVCCSLGDCLGEWDDSLIGAGCPLFMPDARFQHATYREAAAFHKQFSQEMVRRRHEAKQAATLTLPTHQEAV